MVVHSLAAPIALLQMGRKLAPQKNNFKKNNKSIGCVFKCLEIISMQRFFKKRSQAQNKLVTY